jgi:hypothetical protein
MSTRFGNTLFGIPERQRSVLRPPTVGEHNYTLSGVSRDSSGNPLASCTVDLYRTGDNSWCGRTVSDGSGNFTFTGVGPGPFFVRATDAGGTVAGSTLGTLVAV